MAHKHAAIKHLRQTTKRTARNKQVKTRIKDTLKSIQKLIADKKLDEANATLPKLTQLLDKAAKTGVLHRNKAQRLKSRISKKLRRVV